MVTEIALVERLLAVAALDFLVLAPDGCVEQLGDLCDVFLQVGGELREVRLEVVAPQVEFALLGLLAVEALVGIVPWSGALRFRLQYICFCLIRFSRFCTRRMHSQSFKLIN